MKRKHRTLAVLLVLLLSISLTCLSGTQEVQAAKKTAHLKVKKAKKKKNKKKLHKKTKKKKKATKKSRTYRIKKTLVASAVKIRSPKTPVGGDIHKNLRTQDHAYRIGQQTVIGHYDIQKTTELLQLLNQYRVNAGRSSLPASSVLTDAASIRAAEASVSFSHIRPNGNINFTVSPYAAGENLSTGRKTAADMLSGWQASTSHNAVMLSEEFKAAGIAVFAKQITLYGQTTYTYYTALILGR